MVGYAFLNKKDFHPGTFGNIERVYLAEQEAEKKEQDYKARLKKLQEEKYEEELKEYKVKAGLLPKSALNKMDWMYNIDIDDKEKNITEEYLLGKPIEEKFIEKKKQQIFQEEKTNEKNQDFLKLKEDPLFQIKKAQFLKEKRKQEQAEEQSINSFGKYLNQNKKYKSNKNQTDKIFKNYLEEMGPYVKYDKKKNKIKFLHEERKNKKEIDHQKLDKKIKKMKQNYVELKHNKKVKKDKKNQSKNPKFLNKEIFNQLIMNQDLKNEDEKDTESLSNLKRIFIQIFSDNDQIKQEYLNKLQDVCEVVQITIQDVFKFAKENLIYLDESLINDKVLKNKQFQQVPRQLDSELTLQIQQKYFKNLIEETSNKIEQKKEKQAKNQKKQNSKEDIQEQFNLIDVVYILEDFLDHEKFLESFNKSEEKFIQFLITEKQDDSEFIQQNEKLKQYQQQFKEFSQQEGCYRYYDCIQIQIEQIQENEVNQNFINKYFTEPLIEFFNLQEQFLQWKQNKKIFDINFNDNKNKLKNIETNNKNNYLDDLMNQLDQQYNEQQQKQQQSQQDMVQNNDEQIQDIVDQNMNKDQDFKFDQGIFQQREQLKKQQELSKILSYIDMNENQMVEALLKLNLQNKLKEDQQDLKNQIFKHDIYKQIKSEEFINQQYKLLNLNQEQVIQQSEFDDTQLLLYYNQFNCFNNATQIWQQNLNTIPTLQQWKNKEQRENLDKIEYFVQGDIKNLKENFIKKFYKKISDFIILKTIKNENSIQNTNLLIQKNNKIILELSQRPTLQKFDLYQEYKLPIDKDLKQKMIDVQLELEKFNQKLKKNQQPREQHIIEYFEDYDYFSKKHTYSDMNIKLNNQDILMSFIPYFNKNLLKENLDDFYNKKEHVQNQRDFGLGLYFKVTDDLIFQILPNGEFYFENKNLENEFMKITTDGNVIIQTKQLIQQTKQNDCLTPEQFQVEEDIDYETFIIKNKEKEKKDKKQKKVISSSVEEIVKEKEPEEVKEIVKDQIYVYQQNGQQFIFEDSKWKQTDNNGNIIIDNVEIKQLQSMKRSLNFKDKYPYCEIREDGYKKIFVKENQIYTLFNNNLQYLQYENFTQIQKDLYPVIHLKNKQEFKDLFPCDYLSQFNNEFIEVTIGNNITFQLLKKEEGHIIIIQTDKEMYIIDEQGKVYYTQKNLINQFKKNIQSQIKFKENLDIYITELQRTVYLLKKTDMKFQKQKKKKKKDIQKYQNLKQEIIQNFINEVQEQILNGKKKKEIIVNEKEEQNQEQINKADSLKEQQSIVYTVDQLKGYDKTYENLVLEYELEIQQMQEDKKQNNKEKIDINLEQKNLLKLIEDIGQSKAFFYNLLINGQCIEGCFIIDLKQSYINSKNFDTQQIKVEQKNDECYKDLDYITALQMVNIDLELDDNNSFKTVGIQINDEEFQQYFQQYFYLLNKPSIQTKMYLQQNQQQFELKISNDQKDFVQYEENDIIFLTKNKKKKENKKQIIELNFKNKIDLLDYDEIPLEDNLIEKINNKKIYYKYKTDIDKEQLQQQLIRFKKWNQWDKFQSNYFGLKLESLDKKKIQLYKDFESPCIQQQIKNQKVINKEITQLDLNEKLKLINQNIDKNTIIKKETQKNKNEIKKKRKSIEKKLVPLIITKKTKEEIQELQTIENCSKYCLNYFETYEGQNYIKNNLKKDEKKYISRQDQDIINELIQKSKIIEQVESEKEQQTESQFSKQTELSNNKQTTVVGSTQNKFKIKTLSYTKQVELENLKFEKQEKEKQKKERLKKTHLYDVLGNKRKLKPFVKSLYKNDKIKKKKNIKYIEVESQVDNRVKTCSMANKLYMQAASTYQVRNYAPHQTLIQSLDKNKPQDYQMLRKNLMPIYEYNQTDLKDLAFFPTGLDFKNIKQGSYYKTKLNILNESSMSQRIIIRSPIQYPNIFVVVDQGPLAPGMKKKLQIEIDTKDCLTGFFETELLIISKHYEYNIPIKGYIMSLDETQIDNFKPQKKLNMFDKKKQQENFKTFKIEELKKIEDKNSENLNLTNFQTSINIPKMHYDTNMKLTLTRQTHEESLEK